MLELRKVDMWAMIESIGMNKFLCLLLYRHKSKKWSYHLRRNQISTYNYNLGDTLNSKLRNIDFIL